MNNRLSVRRNPQASNWKAAIEEVKSARRLFTQDAGIMTEWERTIYQRELKAQCDAIFPSVASAVIDGEFEGAKRAYKASLAAVEKARTAEINRFDSAKFNTELQALQARVALALQADVNPLRGADTKHSEKLAAIYQEAIQSNDLHKWRAAVEVYKALPLPINDPQERMKINDLAKSAEEAEKRLRDTPELAAARTARLQALDTLHAKQEQLVEVSLQLGQGDPRDPFTGNAFSKAYRSVEWPKVTGNGEAVGEVVIHDENDPAVTGVLWK